MAALVFAIYLIGIISFFLNLKIKDRMDSYPAFFIALVWPIPVSMIFIILFLYFLFILISYLLTILFLPIKLISYLALLPFKHK